MTIKKFFVLVAVAMLMFSFGLATASAIIVSDEKKDTE